MPRFSAFLLGLAGWLTLAPAVAQLPTPTPATRAETGKTTQPLLASGRFYQAGKTNWQPATAPGCVYTDLLATKQIADQLYRANELQQWIGKTDWDYETTFDVPAATLQRRQGNGFFGDTFFDLLPGETKVLTFRSEGATSVAELRKQLVVRTLPDAF